MEATWPLEGGSRRALSAWIVVWAALGLALVVQGVLVRSLAEGGGTADWVLRWRVVPWALWGVSAPLFARLWARWPVGWPLSRGVVALHATVFATWMVASNALLRLPELLAGFDAGTLREILAAAGEFSVPGALAYVLIGLAGRAIWSEEEGASDRPPSEAAAASGSASRLSLNTGERIHLVPFDQVRWIEADGDYVRVHTEERTHRVRDRMKSFERRLPDERFLRVHRSSIVNVSFIRELQPYFNGDYVIVLRDGTALRVPRTRRATIARFLDDPE